MPIVADYRGADAPWPLVNECFKRDCRAAVFDRTVPDCPQHDCREHDWVAWTNRAQVSGPGTPIRCALCGARKCDGEDCALMRHHSEPHADPAPIHDPVLLEEWLA